MVQRKTIYDRLDALLIMLRDDFKGDWIDVGSILVEKAVQANIENNATGIETLLKRLESDNNVHFTNTRIKVQINEGGKDLLSEGGYVQQQKNQIAIIRKGDFVALCLDENEYKNAIDLNKRFEPSYIPYLVIRILSYLSESVFEALVCHGRSFEIANCFGRQNNNFTMITDYHKGKNGVFTFDGIRFFKIMNISEEVDSGAYHFTFQYLNGHSFSEKNLAFMVMPFGNEALNKFYKKNIKDYLLNSDLKIKIVRSDDFTGTDSIPDTIIEQIKKAEFIICDITTCNKNVFFEIGYAAGINKDMVFLLEQNKPADFFDINHKRRIEYSFEREDEFQKVLHDTLISLRNHRI